MEHIFMTLGDFSGYYRLGGPDWTLLTTIASALLLSCLALSSFIRLRGRGDALGRIGIPGVSFLLMLFLVIIGIPFAASQFLSPVFWSRFVLPASFPLYILASKGLSEIKANRIRFSLFSLMVLLLMINTAAFFADTKEEQWRESVAFMELNGMEGDLALINPWYCHVAFDFYFSDEGDIDRALFPKWDFTVDGENIESLPPLVEGRKRVWVFRSYNGDPDNLIAESLESLGYAKTEHKDFRGIGLHLFEAQPP
jgi:hypothetical protein